MMRKTQLRHIDPVSPTMTGWLVSCILHGSLGFMALLFVQRVQLAPQAEPFKWNIAVITPTSIPVAAPEPEASVIPDTPKTLETVKPQQPVPAPAAKPPVSPAPRTIADPVVQDSTSPSPPAEAPVLASQPIPTSIARLALDHPHSSNPPIRTDQLLRELESAPSLAPPPPLDKLSPQLTESTPVEPSPQQIEPSAAALNQSVPREQAPQATAIEQAPKHQLAPIAKGSPSPSAEPPAVPQPDQLNAPHPAAPPIPQVAARSPSSRAKPTKRDYGWLAELMAHWIEDLDKRYPAMLRTEGIQGKVTLTAMLHENGQLSDVQVAKSSGNPMLDQVALEDVRTGPPVNLSRPLERSRMAVKFSIVYNLKTAR